MDNETFKNLQSEIQATMLKLDMLQNKHIEETGSKFVIRGPLFDSKKFVRS